VYRFFGYSWPGDHKDKTQYIILFGVQVWIASEQDRRICMAHHAIFISVSMHQMLRNQAHCSKSLHTLYIVEALKKCISNKYAPRANTVRTYSSKSKFPLLEATSIAIKKTGNINSKTFVKNLHPIYSKNS
jgi:hypothetical protein